MEFDMPKIALACIVKDDSEATQFERMLESFMPFMSGLFVAVTGPSGKHEKIHEIVNKFGGTSLSTTPETHPEIYHEGQFANFAAARNVSWDLVEGDFDWISWADTDDILLNGDAMLAAAYEAIGKYDSDFFNYWYSVRRNEKGNVTDIEIEHLRERLLKPGVFKWVSRLHEVAVAKDGVYEPKWAQYDPKRYGKDSVWIHLTEMESFAPTSERNERILRIQMEEEESKDPRTLFNLAKILILDKDSRSSLEEAESLLVAY